MTQKFKTFIIDDIADYTNLKERFGEISLLSFDLSEKQLRQQSKVHSALKAYYESSNINSDANEYLKELFISHSSEVTLYIIDLQLKEQSRDDINNKFNGLIVYQDFIKLYNPEAKIIFITGVNNNDILNDYRTRINALGPKDKFGLITRHINNEGVWWESNQVKNEFNLILNLFKFKNIFISYASEDEYFIRQFENDIRNHFDSKYNIFIDKDILENGKNWEPQLISKLEFADLGILFVSPNYMTKLFNLSVNSYIKTEYKKLSSKLFLIPLKQITNSAHKGHEILKLHTYFPTPAYLIDGNTNTNNIYFSDMYNITSGQIIKKDLQYFDEYFIKLTEDIDKKFLRICN